MQAIGRHTFVPEKGAPARIDSRGSPRLGDQPPARWGVPIPLSSNGKPARLLVDPRSMRGSPRGARRRRRCVDAVNAPHPSARRATRDYEMIGDILDVWVDSG